MPRQRRSNHRVQAPPQDEIRSHIAPFIIPDARDLSFSFRFFKKDHSIFDCRNQCWEFYVSFLDLMRKLHRINIADFRNSRRNSYHIHQILWENTTHPNGFFHLDTQLQALTPYQIEIPLGRDSGRVYGFLVDSINTFCVVWIDPDHNLFH